jgi:hypothetical protein
LTLQFCSRIAAHTCPSLGIPCTGLIQPHGVHPHTSKIAPPHEQQKAGTCPYGHLGLPPLSPFCGKIPKDRPPSRAAPAQGHHTMHGTPKGPREQRVTPSPAIPCRGALEPRISGNDAGQAGLVRTALSTMLGAWRARTVLEALVWCQLTRGSPCKLPVIAQESLGPTVTSRSGRTDHFLGWREERHHLCCHGMTSRVVRTIKTHHNT